MTLPEVTLELGDVSFEEMERLMLDADERSDIAKDAVVQKPLLTSELPTRVLQFCSKIQTSRIPKSFVVELQTKTVLSSSCMLDERDWSTRWFMFFLKLFLRSVIRL